MLLGKSVSTPFPEVISVDGERAIGSWSASWSAGTIATQQHAMDATFYTTAATESPVTNGFSQIGPEENHDGGWSYLPTLPEESHYAVSPNNSSQATDQSFPKHQHTQACRLSAIFPRLCRTH